MAVKLNTTDTYSVPAAPVGKWTLGTVQVGGEHWLRNQSITGIYPPGNALRDNDRPVAMELRAATIKNSKWQRALAASGTVFGSKARPYNIVIERVKGVYESAKGGTSVLQISQVWLRPATMRTRSTVRAARLTRPETIVSKKGTAP